MSSRAVKLYKYKHQISGPKNLRAIFQMFCSYDCFLQGTEAYFLLWLTGVTESLS